MKNLLLFCFIFLPFLSCEIEPAEINYGKDGCHFCSMTIVDNQHAAQILNNKGKAYKYDAIECMLNDLKKRPSAEIGMILVNDYNEPGELVIAMQAAYLISPAIPSPMGAFLSAGKDASQILTLKNSQGGEMYTWETIKEKFNVE